MIKLGESKITSWKRRYFDFSPDFKMLRYWTKNPDVSASATEKGPKGAIDMSCVTAVIPVIQDTSSFFKKGTCPGLDLVTEERVWHLGFSNVEDRDMCQKTIEKVSSIHRPPALKNSSSESDDGLTLTPVEVSNAKEYLEALGNELKMNGLLLTQEPRAVQISTLPPGWQRYVDKTTNKYYYVNVLDNVTTWDHPASDKEAENKDADVTESEGSQEKVKGLKRFSENESEGPEEGEGPGRCERAGCEEPINVLDNDSVSEDAPLPTIQWKRVDEHVRCLGCRKVHYCSPECRAHDLFKHRAGHCWKRRRRRRRLIPRLLESMEAGMAC